MWIMNLNQATFSPQSHPEGDGEERRLQVAHLATHPPVQVKYKEIVAGGGGGANGGKKWIRNWGGLSIALRPCLLAWRIQNKEKKSYRTIGARTLWGGHRIRDMAPHQTHHHLLFQSQRSSLCTRKWHNLLMRVIITGVMIWMFALLPVWRGGHDKKGACCWLSSRSWCRVVFYRWYVPIHSSVGMLYVGRHVYCAAARTCSQWNSQSSRTLLG